uniref:Uncharacterized protein n=1 Tax=Mola mola TaxID=94237 RepID=A0A3Q3X148_MOLML
MMEDFSGLALPPLFGEHILEAELEPGGVELVPGEVELGPGGNELHESTAREDEAKRALDKRKYLALGRRCKEIEQVFLMKTLDAHGDDYRNAQLTILLEDESGAHIDPAAAGEDEQLNGVPGSSSAAALPHAVGPKKRRHRITRQEKEKEQHTEPDISVLAETQFGEMPSPTSLSH